VVSRTGFDEIESTSDIFHVLQLLSFGINSKPLENIKIFSTLMMSSFTGQQKQFGKKLILIFFVLNATFSYIMATSVSGGGREPPTMGKQLVNFITRGCKSSEDTLHTKFILYFQKYLDLYSEYFAEIESTSDIFHVLQLLSFGINSKPLENIKIFSTLIGKRTFHDATKGKNT
jgi:hypothetical protein